VGTPTYINKGKISNIPIKIFIFTDFLKIFASSTQVIATTTNPQWVRVRLGRLELGVRRLGRFGLG